MLQSQYFERRHDHTLGGWKRMKEKDDYTLSLRLTIPYHGNTKKVVILY